MNHKILHTPAELCSKMIIKYVNLVDIGKISPMVPQIWSKTCLNTHFYEGINQNFNLFLGEYSNLCVWNIEIIEISIISLPSLVILTRFYTSMIFYGWFYRNFDKIHQNDTNYTHQKIEPIKARFSTIDKYQKPHVLVAKLFTIFTRTCSGSYAISWLECRQTNMFDAKTVILYWMSNIVVTNFTVQQFFYVKSMLIH